MKTDTANPLARSPIYLPRRKGTIAVATAAFATMAPAAAHAYGWEDSMALPLFLSFFGPPALLSLIAGFALSTYVRAIAAAVITALGWLVMWNYNVGFGGPSRLLVLFLVFVIANVPVALAAHALRRYWLSTQNS